MSRSNSRPCLARCQEMPCRRQKADNVPRPTMIVFLGQSFRRRRLPGDVDSFLRRSSLKNKAAHRRWVRSARRQDEAGLAGGVWVRSVEGVQLQFSRDHGRWVRSACGSSEAKRICRWSLFVVGSYLKIRLSGRWVRLAHRLGSVVIPLSPERSRREQAGMGLFLDSPKRSQLRGGRLRRGPSSAQVFAGCPRLTLPGEFDTTPTLDGF